jgi:hypothetical protein
VQLFYITGGFFFILFFAGQFFYRKELRHQYWYSDDYEWRSPTKKEMPGAIASSSLIGILMGGVLSVFLMFVILPMFSHPITTGKDRLAYTLEIKSFQDNQVYIVSRNDVNETGRYYFLRKWGDGWKSGWIPQDAAVVYDATANYRVEAYQKEFRIKDGYFARQCVDFLGTSTLIDTTTGGYDTHYKVYIPSGTIKGEFNTVTKG